MREVDMAVKVYVPGKNAPRNYSQGTRFYVGDNGHLFVVAPWDRETQEAETLAIFAPGQWSHAAKADASADQD